MTLIFGSHAFEFLGSTCRGLRIAPEVSLARNKTGQSLSDLTSSLRGYKMSKQARLFRQLTPQWQTVLIQLLEGVEVFEEPPAERLKYIVSEQAHDGLDGRTSDPVVREDEGNAEAHK